ncbi:hypothetical protein JCM19233_674 [Vibrio astriarenae]|nr:hypothetical protein JCM19233_674 [Vibrio sp. C7]
MTVTEVNEDNVVTLTSKDGRTVRLLLAKVKKLINTVDTLDSAKQTIKDKVSLVDLAKRNKRAQGIKKAVDGMLSDYGA